MAKYREKKAVQAVQSLINDEASPESSIISKDIAPNYQPAGGSQNQQGGNYHHRQQSPRDRKTVGASVDEEILLEKEKQIRELHETVEILELKIAKLEQLLRLKDNKIEKLMSSVKRNS